MRTFTSRLAGQKNDNVPAHFPGRPILLSLSLLVAIGAATNSFAAGIAAFKEQAFHADSSANFVIYKHIIIDAQAPFVRMETEKGTVTMEKAKFVGHVDLLPGIPDMITTDAQAAYLRNAARAVTDYAKKFPKSEPTLRPYVTSYTAHLAKFDAGNIRFYGEWKTGAEYAAIMADSQMATEKMRQEQIETVRRYERTRLEWEAKINEQRDKGLELYEGKWLPIAQVRALEKRDTEVAAATEAILEKSVKTAIYSIFQVIDDGVLINLHSGKIQRKDINSDFGFLISTAQGLTADGDRFKADLYWCGTYSYMNTLGYQTTANAYTLDERQAVARVRSILFGTTGTGTPTPNQPSQGQSGPLVGASGSGSGFFVGTNGYFITNAHVVEDATRTAIHYQGQSLPTKIVHVDKQSDLAILKVDKPVRGISFAEKQGDIGQDAYAIGYPNPTIQGLAVKVTKGIISSTRGIDENNSHFQIDAAVQPGNSGGPLCDTTGRLLGVIVAELNAMAVARETGSIPQNVNYAIKASVLVSLLRSQSIDFTTPGESALSIKDASAATGLVVVWSAKD